jgi:hypothetical protein
MNFPQFLDRIPQNSKQIKILSKLQLPKLIGAHFPSEHRVQTHMFYKVEKCPRPQMPFSFSPLFTGVSVHHEGIGKIFVLYWRSMYGNHEKSSLCLRVGDKI